jgi:hypothetical protein
MPSRNDKTFEVRRITSSMLALSCLLFFAAPPVRSQALEVDFNQVVRGSGPYMFGGAHIPPAEHAGAMEALRTAGVGHIRFDISLEDILPANIGLQDYLANSGGVADPARWNWKLENEIGRVRAAGLSAYGVILWNPGWLTKNGKNNGEVVNYDVWEDIVRKVLVRLGSRFEYIEIWNEPCWTAFLDSGSDWSVERVKQVTVEYHRRALRAAQGLGLKLGGPACYGWWRDTLIEAILADEFIRKQISFVSWHYYDKDQADYIDFERTVSMIRERAGRDLDIHVSEWNYSAGPDSYPEFQNSPRAAAWVAMKLIQFYRLGVDASTMYHLSNGPWGFEYRDGNGKWGGYEWRDGRAIPYGFLSAFTLIARTLGLGQLGAKVAVVDSRQVDMPASLAGVGLKNGAQANVILLANHGSGQAVSLSIRVKSPSAGVAAVALQAFATGAEARVFDGTSLLRENLVVTRDGYALVRVEVPAYTAVGLRLDWKSPPAAPLLNPIP